MRFYSFLIFAICIAVWTTNVTAEPNRLPPTQTSLQLESKRSPVFVTLDSGLVRISGRIDKLQGEWNRSSGGQLVLRANLRDVTFDPVNGLDISGFTQSALPNKEVVFRSTSLNGIKSGQAKLTGTATFSGRDYSISAPVTVQTDQRGTSLSIARRETIREWPAQIPLPVVPGQTEGEVRATLYFK